MSSNSSASTNTGLELVVNNAPGAIDKGLAHALSVYGAYVKRTGDHILVWIPKQISPDLIKRTIVDFGFTWESAQ